ncbi:rhombosortase [Idiomarina seosinensis]|uniref:rhombosortase n=1 Tax=Idiomarina seosinensis TaxID=281739 RepID=UPI00384A98B2
MQKLQHYSVGLILTLTFMTLLQFMPDWHLSLTYRSSDALTQGWPLLSAHFVHLNWPHALFNFAGLTLIVLIWRHLFTSRWLINAVLISAVSTSLLLLLLPQDIQFVGLSGVLHGLLMYCLIKDSRQQRWLLIVAAALVIKVIAELSGWRPAHFVGDDVAYIHAAGLLSSLLLLKLEQRRISDAVPETLKQDKQDP